MRKHKVASCWLLRKPRRKPRYIILAIFIFLCPFSVYLNKCIMSRHSEQIGSRLSNQIITIKPSSPVKGTNFSLIIPHIKPNLSLEQQLYVVVMVNSAASGQYHRLLRHTIRKTWGNSTNSLNNNDRWKLFFALGISDDEMQNEINLQEAVHNNDVIIGHFGDHYKNLALKTFMSYFWVVSKLPSCKYVLKTDDDVYVRVPQLITWLRDREESSPYPLYGGFLALHYWVHRDPASKWFISEDEFGELSWPPFCHGAFYVLSTDILPKYFNYALYRRKPFHTDDAYLGVVARDLGIVAEKITGFNLDFMPIKLQSECKLLDSIAVGHHLDASTMREYHSFYNNQNRTNKNCPSRGPEDLLDLLTYL